MHDEDGAMPKRTVERRRHKRFEIRCPLKILTEADGDVVTTAGTVNVSDGGVLVCVPIEAIPKCSSALKVSLSVPRKTPNTFMMEDFHSRAKVLREVPFRDDRLAGVAIKFEQPLQLALEV